MTRDLVWHEDLQCIKTVLTALRFYQYWLSNGILPPREELRDIVNIAADGGTVPLTPEDIDYLCDEIRNG